MARLVAAQYAKGLFELALETGRFDSISDSIMGLKEVAEDDEFRLIIGHPQISDEQKYDILKNCVPQTASDELFGFFRLLVTRNRIAILSEIIEEYTKLVDERQNVVRARVISAEKLAEAELGRIRILLAKRFNKTVKFVQELDASVIAGVRVYVGDELIDTSVKKDIDDIRNSLLEHAR